MTNDNPSISEQAYRRLLDTLLKSAAVVTGPLGARNSRERTDGFRHLLRLASVASEMFVENGDRAYPVFTRWMEAGRKMLGDNPWTIYDAALISPDCTYSLKGQRGTPTYLGFCVYGTKENGARCIVSNIDDIELQFNADGSFELILSKERPKGAVNWLKLDDDATDVMVRQYFLNRPEQQKAHYTISAQPQPPLPVALSEEELAKRIDEAARWVFEIINVETTLSAISESTTPAVMRKGTDLVGDEENVIDYSWIAKAMPTPAITYTARWIKDLGEDEAFVVTGKPPKARYWSLSLLSRFLESPDYRYHKAFFTSENTILEADGSFRIVVAHRDPGAANWLDTTGLVNGQLAVRALHEENENIEMEFQRIKL